MRVLRKIGIYLWACGKKLAVKCMKYGVLFPVKNIKEQRCLHSTF